MNIYRYDKSFEGLLCVVFAAYTRKIFPDALLGPEEMDEAPAAQGLPVLPGLPLLDAKQGHVRPAPVSALPASLPLLPANSFQVTSSPEQAGRVFAALRKKLSGAGVQRLLAAWLAEEPGGDLRIFRFIRLVLDSAVLLESDCGDPTVFALGQMARRVNRERHQLMGFVRFQKTAQGIYFSAIAPRHNVLPLLLNHFTQRMADQPWIIYDLGRRYGMYYDLRGVQEVWLDELDELDEADAADAVGETGEARVADEMAGRLEEVSTVPVRLGAVNTASGRLDESLLAEDEALIQKMWQGYFKSAAIRERRNPSLQRQFMPRRYWPYLTELQS